LQQTICLFRVDQTSHHPEQLLGGVGLWQVTEFADGGLSAKSEMRGTKTKGTEKVEIPLCPHFHAF
jgi:hypothetical protein